MSRKPPHNEVNIVEDTDKINVHVFRKPVTRRLALRLLSVDSQPRYTMPVRNFIVLVKAPLNYDQALEGAIAVTAEHVIREAARREREAKKSPRKKSWGAKTRNPFRHYLEYKPSFHEAYEMALAVACSVFTMLGGPVKPRLSGVGRHNTYDPVKVFAALLVKKLFDLSFGELSRALRQNSVNLSLGKESYPSASTLYRYYIKTPLLCYQLAVMVLWLRAYSRFAAKFYKGLVVAVDSSYVSLDLYVERLQKGVERLFRAKYKFYVCSWLKFNMIVFLCFSKDELNGFLSMMPGGVLLGDGEFSDRKFLFRLRSKFLISVRVRFRPWIGARFAPLYRLRKLVERVFGCFERRGASRSGLGLSPLLGVTCV